MPNIEMLIDTISQHLTNTQSGQQAYFTTLDLKYAYSKLNYTMTLKNTVISTISVGNPPAFIDSKLDSTVLLTCRQSFRKQWTTL